MPSSIDRRNFLRFSALASLAPSALAAAATIAPREQMFQLNGYALDAETPLELLTDYTTPTELVFVRSHWIPHMPELAKWRLTIDGEVHSPMQLSLADLKKLPVTEVTAVLQCAGNGRALYTPILPGVQWRYGAVANVRWRGVRVRDVLARAGVGAEAKHLHAFGSDAPPRDVPPFLRSIEIEKVMNDGLLVWEMNGQPLLPQHGAPLRLVVPGWAGDHWMKWLVRLSPQREPQKGFFMDTAYRFPIAPGAPGVAFKPEEMKPVTELFVKSNITSAPTMVRSGTKNRISGFAFSGAPGIENVELSDDDGATWNPAKLDAQRGPYAWRRWSYDWMAKAAGTAQLLARATDVRGTVQPREAIWNQSGYLYNGWHSVTIEVQG